jgi:hypothetical protein
MPTPTFSQATPYISNSAAAIDAASNPSVHPPEAPVEEPALPLLPSATKTEKFLLTAADQESGTRDERLSRVIRSKYEAGLLKPYDYVKGYARLSRWMDRKYVNVFSWRDNDLTAVHLKCLSAIEATNSATVVCAATQVPSERGTFMTFDKVSNHT